MKIKLYYFSYKSHLPFRGVPSSILSLVRIKEVGKAKLLPCTRWGKVFCREISLGSFVKKKPGSKWIILWHWNFILRYCCIIFPPPPFPCFPSTLIYYLLPPYPYVSLSLNTSPSSQNSLFPHNTRTSPSSSTRSSPLPRTTSYLHVFLLQNVGSGGGSNMLYVP